MNDFSQFSDYSRVISNLQFEVNPEKADSLIIWRETLFSGSIAHTLVRHGLLYPTPRFPLRRWLLTPRWLE